jgi:hypothetical protein
MTRVLDIIRLLLLLALIAILALVLTDLVVSKTTAAVYVALSLAVLFADTAIGAVVERRRSAERRIAARTAGLSDEAIERYFGRG